MNDFPIKKSADLKGFINSTIDRNLFPKEYVIQENFVNEIKNEKKFLKQLSKYCKTYGTDVLNDEGRYHCIQEKHFITEFQEQKDFVYDLEDKLIALLENNGISDFRDNYSTPIISILASLQAGCNAQYLHSDYPKNKTDIPISNKSFIALIALEDNTKLDIGYYDKIDKSWKRDTIVIPKYSLFLARGCFIHAGSYYKNANVRIHFYLDHISSTRETDVTYYVEIIAKVIKDNKIENKFIIKDKIPGELYKYNIEEKFPIDYTNYFDQCVKNLSKVKEEKKKKKEKCKFKMINLREKRKK